jgi:hypothetical protein
MASNDTVRLLVPLEPQDVEVCVYRITCGCGADLKYDVNADRDNDLLIDVDPHRCDQEEE